MVTPPKVYACASPHAGKEELELAGMLMDTACWDKGSALVAEDKDTMLTPAASARGKEEFN